MIEETLKANLRTIPDFPKKGILFYDITTLFKSSECLSLMADALYDLYKDKGITKVVGIESRGYILGAILAARLGAGFIPVRKAGKLPAQVYSESYDLEYGTGVIEIHTDAVSADDVVLIHDDLLATGGTLDAARRLVERSTPKAIYMNCVIELVELEGRKSIAGDTELTSLLKL